MSATWYTDDARKRAKKAAADGLLDAAEYGLEVANRTVPLEEGELSRSGFTDIDREKLIAIIAYDEIYARRQHEELSYRHAPGRRAKWLEKTMQEEFDAMVGHIAKAIDKALD